MNTEQTNQQTNKQMNEQTIAWWVDGWMDGWMDGWVGGWMDGWMDATLQVVDDGKGFVWVAAEMSPGGLAIELFKSVPFGKRALFCAKASNIDEMFDKINWDLMDKRIDTTLGGPQVKQRWTTISFAAEVKLSKTARQMVLCET